VTTRPHRLAALAAHPLALAGTPAVARAPVAALVKAARRKPAAQVKRAPPRAAAQETLVRATPQAKVEPRARTAERAALLVDPVELPPAAADTPAAAAAQVELPVELAVLPVELAELQAELAELLVDRAEHRLAPAEPQPALVEQVAELAELPVEPAERPRWRRTAPPCAVIKRPSHAPTAMLASTAARALAVRKERHSQTSTPQ
jgi:hypothetical protein